MKLDTHLLTSALALVRAGRGLASAIPVDTRQSVCQPDKSYEPHCLMTWAEMCAGMDSMAGIEAAK